MEPGRRTAQLARQPVSHRINARLCAALERQRRCHQGQQASAAHNPALFIRRRDFALAAEYCIARDGGGRRSPVLGPACTPGRAGRLSGAGHDMPTTGRVLPHARQQAEQVRHGWRGGWNRGGWPSARPKRRSSTWTEGFDFLAFNIRRYRNGKLIIKPGADGHQEVPRQACEGIPRTSRGQRRRGTGEDSPRSTGAGPPTTGRWCIQGVYPPWTNYQWKLPYKWDLLEPPEQAETLDRRPVLPRVQQGQG